MAPSDICDTIIQQIKKSNLHFILSENAFSAQITLRKKLIVQERFHQNLLKTAESEKADRFLEKQLANLKADLDHVKHVNAELETQLEHQIKHYKSDLNHLKDANKQLAIANRNLEEAKVDVETKKIETLKADKRALEIKHEKLCAENKVLKNEKDDLNKELNVAKVALKTTRKEAKDNLQQFKKENKSLEEKIRNLLDFKNAKLSEERDLKIKMKKVEKRVKNLNEREVKLVVVERKGLEMFEGKCSAENVTPEIEPHKKNVEEVSNEKEAKEKKDETKITTVCNHSPQCIFRQPLPPPIGPPTKEQFETRESVLKCEAKEKELDSCAAQILDFFNSEPLNDIDVTIWKLQQIKSLLEPNNENVEPSQFDDLIKQAENYKQAMDNLVNNQEDDDHLYEDYFDDDLPRHFWGGDDGNELFFEDDET